MNLQHLVLNVGMQRATEFSRVFFQISRGFFFQKSVLNAEAGKQASKWASKPASKQARKPASQPASKQASKGRQGKGGYIS